MMTVAEQHKADRAAAREVKLLYAEIDSEAYDARLCEIIRLARLAARVLSTELEQLVDDEELEDEAGIEEEGP